ncbi:putative peptidoglycan-binding domain-containing protein [Teichococcus deserti]|uniref:putative peptidoglycan-binding domain-containing protein n=1 Tax=Teichococcus deserti TaxID=1817963 RepID=UPI001F61A74E|nr:putative peptidoglycan-binding domain-containing protein [Pseudoroseomonas deserti]
MKLLQASIGTPADGLIGPATLAALRRAVGDGDPDRVTAVAIEFQARRIVLMAALSTWPTFGLGWARRLASLPFQAMRLAS